MTSLLEWLSEGIVAQALTASPVLYVFANAAHILAIGLLVGAILPLDLRLLGLFKRTPLQLLGPFLSRAAATGAVLAILTGMALFTVRANEYVGNPAFLTKMGLLAAGIANVVLLRIASPWRRTLSEDRGPWSIKLMAAMSFAIWIAAVIAGRWIGFI
ncbi:DUF6644 family protein [Halotalea alkalilenta]|uniref:DUF6644 domain-containing protein n=1 Tax=Halotalea alkalilenta TaxID=376489 RepID=A0A172YHC9_9GAMM|nr:DUF6644 family protein [Halotalea alkalilenta]ANF58526.1 hypothetical protein A5892_14450 [Halotalea alkalilenta]